MERLNELYRQLLSAGFIVLRQAIDAKDVEWASHEVEFLHNVPSLIDEPNHERHLYFWNTERPHYLDWANLPGREKARSRMQTYYAPLWREMEPLLLQALGPTCLHDSSPTVADAAAFDHP